MTRLAKAMSAFNFGRSAQGAGRDARSFAGRGVSLGADGSGAPSTVAPLVPAVIALTLSLAVSLALAAAPASASKIIYDSFGTGPGSAGGQVNQPRGVAVNHTGAGAAGAGDVYVAERENHRIEQFDAKGNFIRAFGQDVITNTGTPANSNGTGYEVCDTTTEPPNTAAECKAGTTGAGTGGAMNQPVGVAVDQADGSVYVFDSAKLRIQKFDAVGNFLWATGKDVVTGGVTTTEVCTVANDCKNGVAGTLGGEFGTNNAAIERGIAVDPTDGSLYVSDPGNRRVQQLSSAGAFIRAFGQDVQGINEVQTVRVEGASSGTYTLSFDGHTTGPIDFNATAATVQTALRALPSIDGDVNVTGVAGNNTLRTRVVTFVGELAGTDVPELTADASGLNVGAAITVEETTKGAGGNFDGFEVCEDATICSAGVAGSGLGQFGTNTPNGVAVDSTGAIYSVEAASNFRVQKFVPQVGPPALAPQAFAEAALKGVDGNTNPTQVAVDSTNDEVYVAKAFKSEPPLTVGERRILQLSSTGELLDTHIEGEGLSNNGDGSFPAGGLAYNPTLDRLYSAAVTPEQAVYIIAEPPDRAPIVATGQVSAGAADHLRTLQGTVNPDGFKVTECRFLYGKTSAYGEVATCSPPAGALGDGEAPLPVSAETEPLDPNTTYHYRLTAANAGKAGQGKDRTFTTGPAPADGCANAAIRAAQGIETLLLPDCMALEQVSPANKGNQHARLPAAVSADGSSVLFQSISGLGDCSNLEALLGNPSMASRRSASDWRIVCATPRHPVGVPGSPPHSLAPDFSAWISRGTDDASKEIYRFFQQDGDGLGAALSPPLPLPFGSDGVHSPQPRGTARDHSQVYFLNNRLEGLSTRYIEGDPTPSGTGFDSNVYVAGRDSEDNPSLSLLARDRDGKAWGGSCGARLGGMRDHPGIALIMYNGRRNQGAVSHDGGRVYFSTRPAASGGGECDGLFFGFPSGAHKLRILERLETPSGPEIDELVPNECDRAAPACSSVDGDDLYEGASRDQRRVYFTTTRQLADSDLDVSNFSGFPLSCNPSMDTVGCDLYLLDRDRPAGEQLIQVSAGDEGADTPGEGAAVRSSITAISADGSRAYFVARSKLTDDKNPAGAEAQDEDYNLYLYEHPSEDLSFIGALAAADGGFGGLFGGEGNWENRAYAVPNAGAGDGRVLFFRTYAQLSADDEDSAADLYRYDAAAGTLERVSVAPPGGSDNAEIDIELPLSNQVRGTDYAELLRWASEDGQTAVFTTEEALLPGDTNGVEDAYMWRKGQVYRLPGSSRPGTKLPRNRVVLSHDGSTVAFHSAEQLLPSDGDTAQDVYVARVGGGSLAAEPPPVCQGEACQGAPGTASPDVGAASAGFAGRGNLVEGHSCARHARQAQRLSKRAKSGRRNARRLARNGKRGQAKALHRRAARLAKQAKRSNNAAKRCRRANRGAGR